LANIALDWSDRDVTFKDRQLTVSNDEVRLALHDHRMIKDKRMFPVEQATLRDSYDAQQSFFNRIESSLSTKLIDVVPTEAYFAYWIERLVRFDRHNNDSGIMGTAKPAELVAAYIKVYGDQASITNLCKQFDVAPPKFGS